MIFFENTLRFDKITAKIRQNLF